MKSFACDSAGCYLGHVLACGAGGSLRSLKASRSNKMDAKAAILWSSNVNTLTPYVFADTALQIFV